MTTREGGGRPAVGREHSSSQITRKAISTTIGGIRLTAIWRNVARVTKGLRGALAAGFAAAPVTAMVEVLAITRSS